MAQPQPIVGDVEKGRRKLSGKVYVYHPDENPLIGAWHVDTRVACGATQEIKAAAIGPVTLRGYDWSFHASQQFWVGREQSMRGSRWNLKQLGSGMRLSPVAIVGSRLLPRPLKRVIQITLVITIQVL
jgi:hypothetical protein